MDPSVNDLVRAIEEQRHLTVRTPSIPRQPGARQHSRRRHAMARQLRRLADTIDG